MGKRSPIKLSDKTNWPLPDWQRLSVVHKLSDFLELAVVVKLPILALAGGDFGLQASRSDMTVINLSTRGLELNIQNLELNYLLSQKARGNSKNLVIADFEIFRMF
jgi:hypothetical protein